MTPDRIAELRALIKRVRSEQGIWDSDASDDARILVGFGEALDAIERVRALAVSLEDRHNRACLDWDPRSDIADELLAALEGRR